MCPPLLLRLLPLLRRDVPLPRRAVLLRGLLLRVELFLRDVPDALLRALLLLDELLLDELFRDELFRDELALRFFAAARPPFLPPFFEAERFAFLPRPLPDFLPPPSSAFTVAYAMRAAVFELPPRFFTPSSMCFARRRCLDVYERLLPWAIRSSCG